jgi:anthranilate phosphoribosyltransferase
VSYAALIRQIEAGNGLGFDDASRLGAALLDDGVPELETAAFVMALHQHDPGIEGWLGLHTALAARLPHWSLPPGPLRPVLLPAYYGVRTRPHLTPLLALLLRHFDIPVLIHGVLDGGGGTAAAYVLRELGVMPCASAAQVATQLSATGLAFAPAALLHPGLASLLALRARLGVDTLATRLALFADPLGGAVRVVPAADAASMCAMEPVLAAQGGHALLLTGCEGEAFADPLQRPAMRLLRDGAAEHAYAAQTGVSATPGLPSPDARASGAWIRDVLERQLPLPLPIRNQLAVCLYAAGYADDLNQARAIAAIDGFGLAA